MSKHVSKVDGRITFLMPDTMNAKDQACMVAAIDDGIVANCGERKTFYTPGPWEAWKTGAGNVYVGTEGQKEVVCKVGEIGALNAEANARLVACAPDMLAVLEGLLCMGHGVGCESRNGGECGCWLKQATDVIDRANGAR